MTKIARIVSRKSIAWNTVPVPFMAEGMRLYYEKGCLPGGFMQAMLSADYSMAARLADRENKPKIADWIEWIEGNLDPLSYGSADRMKAWSAERLAKDPVGRELEEVHRAIGELEDDLARLEGRRAALEGQTTIRCESNVAYGRGCGAEFPINEITYIATHWYTRPSGCTDGDYWTEGEGMFICPSCAHRNRLFDREHYQKLKGRFAKVMNQYDRD